MDSDRRSGYYQQYDNDASTNARAAPPSHGRNQSNTSGYYQGRPSREMLTDPQNANYHDSTGVPSPRQNAFQSSKPNDFTQESGWDVYADFNNAGPKYSSLNTTSDGYQSIPSPTVARPKFSAPPTNGSDPENPVELVTVPALGAEWKAEELRGMTKKGRKEDKNFERKERWKAWNRDQSGCCGGWGTRRAIVWTLFIACCVTGIILAFTIPRAPGFIYNKDAPLAASSNPDDEPKFGTFPASFLFNATLDVHVDTGSNFLPLRFNHLRAEVADLGTSKLIATGDLGSYLLPAKSYTRVLVPLLFNYTAANTTDQTWANVYNACKNKNQFSDGVRPGISISVALFMDIAGLVTHPATSATLTDTPCPFELSSSASG